MKMYFKRHIWNLLLCSFFVSVSILFFTDSSIHYSQFSFNFLTNVEYFESSSVNNNNNNNVEINKTLDKSSNRVTKTHRYRLIDLVTVKEFTISGGTRKESVYSETLTLTDMALTHSKICSNNDWQRILSPCQLSYSWTQRETDKEKITSLNRSRVEIYLRPAGYPSVLKIFSRNQLGKYKRMGGDFWRVHISGNQISMSVGIRDKEDGSYEGIFILLEPGGYDLHIALEHSLCDGIRDPPIDWFKIGTIQGKFQPHGILGPIEHFINEIQKINFSVQQKTYIHHEAQKRDKLACQSINKNCGYWRNNTYKPYKKLKNYSFSHVNKHKKLDTLWIYGDSNARRFHWSLEKHNICKNVFLNCKITYTWTYVHFNKYNHLEDRTVYDGKDFNETKFLEPIRNTMLAEGMRTNSSFLLINFGLHVMMTLQFERAKILFQSFLAMIKELKMTHGDNFPTIIWKSTTPPTIESSKMFNITHTRFFTKHRIILWNAYTLSEACKANIPVLDVYNMALSNPSGALDHAHYKDSVFKSAEDELMEYILSDTK